MTLKYLLATAAFVGRVTVPSLAKAEGEDVCETACEEGTVKTGFLDGQVGTCVCLPQGAGMEDVTPEESVGAESPDV